jgi:hypothetical protein
MPVDFPNKRAHTTWSSMCAAEHTAGPVIHIHAIQFQHLSIILKSFSNYIHSGQYLYICDRDSSVGTATCYGLESPGFESRWRQDFSIPGMTCPGAHQASCTLGTESHLTTHSHLAARLKKEQSYTSTPAWAFMPVYRVNLTCTSVCKFHFNNIPRPQKVRGCCPNAEIHLEHKLRRKNKFSLS